MKKDMHQGTLNTIRMEIRAHKFAKKWVKHSNTRLPWAPCMSSTQAFWYSPSSMVTFTSTSSPSASSLYSSVTKKSCRCFWRVPSWYNFHKSLRADKLSAWTVRHTQPSVIWTSLVPAGSTQVCTAATSWSNEDQRLKTSMAETTVRLPATTLNTVLMFTTENNKNIYICFVIWLILQRIVVLFFQLIRAARMRFHVDSLLEQRLLDNGPVLYSLIVLNCRVQGTGWALLREFTKKFFGWLTSYQCASDGWHKSSSLCYINGTTGVSQFRELQLDQRKLSQVLYLLHEIYIKSAQ